jgi:hypothetical protein
MAKIERGEYLEGINAGKPGREMEALIAQIFRDREDAKRRGEMTLAELRVRLEECYRSGFRFPRMGKSH